MERRELLGALGATAAGIAAFAGASRTGTAEAHDVKDDAHSKCAEACVDCSKHCNEGFHHCYKMVAEGKAAHAKTMHLLVDCGDICATSGKLVARMSPLMVHTCDACAECCEDTLAAVEKMNDPEMKEVMNALKTCIGTCKEMVKSMGGHAH